MKVRKLRKRSETGYTFAVNFGPFWVRNWWFNLDKNNVVGPAVYVNGKQFSHVLGHGMHFSRLRDIVARMVREGIDEYDSDDMVSVGGRTPIQDFSKKAHAELAAEDEQEELAEAA